MKHFIMTLYGDPGVGKSVFALGLPKPYFITTDGNYEWLEEFGAKPEDHKQVGSWKEAKTLFTSSFDKYDTLVIDLLEDLFKWCEYEYCVEKKVDHISDIGYGKGYDATRNEFFIEMCKLMNKGKNIVFISHEEVKITKDRRGVEKEYHKPSNRVPDKLMDMIEGRCRYVLRCYLKSEDKDDGTTIKRRYLSLVPKENEYGIIRGVNENYLPSDIELDAKKFLDVIGMSLPTNLQEDESKEPVKEEKPVEAKTVRKSRKVKEEKVEEPKEEVNETTETTEKEDKVVDVEVNEEEQPIKEESKPEVKEEPKTETKPLTNAEKIAAIKAKLAARKGENK